jgi:hypothetical protein
MDNNLVTLDRQEYDALKEIEREAKTLKKIIDNDEPLIISMSEGYGGEQRYNVYSGRDKVKDLFLQLEKAIEYERKRNDDIEKRYKKSQEVLKYVKENI